MHESKKADIKCPVSSNMNNNFSNFKCDENYTVLFRIEKIKTNFPDCTKKNDVS